jgi:hypothetical protein
VSECVCVGGGGAGTDGTWLVSVRPSIIKSSLLACTTHLLSLRMLLSVQSRTVDATLSSRLPMPRGNTHSSVCKSACLFLVLFAPNFLLCVYG